MGIEILPVDGLGEIVPGDDLAALIMARASLRAGDVVVVSQKIVSKAENALVRVPHGEPADAARRRIAREEASEVVADAPWVLIVRTRHGLVCANAGIDSSNVEHGLLTLLPADPDASAARLRAAFADRGFDVAVVIADTFGRPWRTGQTDVAIGAAGFEVLHDERGGRDRQGAELTATEIAVADELAAAADLVRTKASGVPAVIVRGFALRPSGSSAARDLVRDAATDLFARGRGMLGAALLAEWPSAFRAGVEEEDVQAVRRVAPDVVVAAHGPPTTLSFDDPLSAGLAAAVLADRGLRVRWHVRGFRVTVEAGHPREGR